MKIINLPLTKLINFFRQEAKTSILLKNSLNLMLASGLTAAFGFLFWVIIARSFASDVVGLATTLLSVGTLLSLLGLAGFDSLFLRFLAKSKKPNEMINNGLLITGLVSAMIAGVFCLLLPILSPKLQTLLQGGWYVLIFIISTVFMSWNILTNTILIAYRRTHFVLIIDIIFSIIKLSLPFMLSSGGPMTIFIIVAIAQIINVILSLGVIMKYFNYTPSFKLSISSLRENLHFGLTTYAAQILNLLPASVLPIIVINNLGASAAAHFYIAFAIANLLYTIAYTTNQALLAEAANDEKRFTQHAAKGLKIVSGLLTPAIILTIIFCPIVLSVFGKNYSDEAVGLLRVMSIGGFAVMFYSFLAFIFKQRKNLKAMLFMTATNAISIITLSVFFVKIFGLTGVGWAWLIGTVIATAIGSIGLLLSRKTDKNLTTTPRKIVVSHFYSKHNNGDAALLSVLLSDIKNQFKNFSVTVLAADPVKRNEQFENAKMQSSFMFYAMNRYNNRVLTLLYALYIMIITTIWAYIYKFTGLSLSIPRKLREICLTYANSDLILPVGGGYMRGQNKGIGSLLYVSLLLHPIKLSKILNKPTILYTQSIGPFSNRIEEYVVKYVLNNYVSASIVREDTSFNLLKRIGVKNDIYRGIDSGFGFSPAKTSYDVHKLLGIKTNKLVIGITAKKYLKGLAQKRYEQALAQTAKYIVTKYNAAVVFIPQVTAKFHGDDDRIVHDNIRRHISGLKNVYVINDILNHYEIKSVYDSLDLLIGTRFHSVIFSLTSNVPAIGIEYEHKTSGIMHDLNLDKWVIKIEDVKANNMIRLLEELMHERKSYRKYLKSVVPVYAEKAASAIKIVNEHYIRFSNSEKSGNFLTKFFNNIGMFSKLVVPGLRKAYAGQLQ